MRTAPIRKDLILWLAGSLSVPLLLIAACSDSSSPSAPPAPPAAAKQPVEEAPAQEVIHAKSVRPYCYTSNEVAVAVKLLKNPKVRAALDAKDPDLRIIYDETCFQEIELFYLPYREGDFLDSSIGEDPTWKFIEQQTPEGLSPRVVLAAVVELHDAGLQ